MERPKCKLCSRTFANGRALGGHMKAHLATLPLPPKPLLTSTSASSASSDDEKALVYALRENPRRALRFSDPEEEESEAESARRRPKRARGAASGEEEEEEDEDAVAIAMCLVMLSRDKWTSAAAAKTDVKRHRCEVCNKAFRSSQALGGHRVTHRKAMSVKELEAAKCRRRFRYEEGEEEEEGEKIFECPYCFKVFGSGQALGGHKRSHLTGSANGPTPVISAKPRYQKHGSLIDLNLPAPAEEDDDRSVVSDGEIAEPLPQPQPTRG